MAETKTKRDEERSQSSNSGRDHDETGLSLGGRRVLSASPLIWVLLAGAVAWAVWATVTRGSSSSSGAGMRAVVVPTSGGDRMVVALPCGSSGGSGGGSRGGTSVVLPAGSGLRVVLLPGCASSGGGSGGGSGGSSGGSGGSGPSGLLVLAPGTPAPKPGSSAPSSGGSGSGGSGSGGSGEKVASVFQAPASAKLIVATPCQGKSGGSSASSGGSSSSGGSAAVSSGRGVLVTPPCGGG